MEPSCDAMPRHLNLDSHRAWLRESVTVCGPLRATTCRTLLVENGLNERRGAETIENLPLLNEPLWFVTLSGCLDPGQRSRLTLHLIAAIK